MTYEYKKWEKPGGLMDIPRSWGNVYINKVI